MAITHATADRNDIANLVVGNATTLANGTNHKLIVYSGTPPANAAAALSGNTAIATITAIAWGAAASGVAAISGSTADPSAVGGTATFFRLTRSDGTTVIIQGTVGTSGTDATVGSTTIAAASTVSISSGTYTSPL